MSKTRAQVVNLALEELQAFGSGQEPEAEDYETVDGRFDGVVAELSSVGIYTLADESEIPDEVSGPLAECLAVESSPAFGLPKDLGKRDDARTRLRVIAQRIDPPSRYLTCDDMTGAPVGLSYARWLRGG
jgi:hypothetical protein